MSAEPKWEMFMFICLMGKVYSLGNVSSEKKASESTFKKESFHGPKKLSKKDVKVINKNVRLVAIETRFP